MTNSKLKKTYNEILADVFSHIKDLQIDDLQNGSVINTMLELEERRIDLVKYKGLVKFLAQLDNRFNRYVKSSLL